MVNNKVRLSVVIVAYNSSKLLKECLHSIYTYNDIGEQLEVLIVDNKSQDIEQLNGLLSSTYKSVRLIENTTNGGYGQGNNLGIKNATGDVILIMNPDARCKEPIFKRALNQFNDTNCVLLGMKQWDEDLCEGESFRFDSPYSCFLKDLITLKIANKFGWFNSNRMYISGSCFFTKKEKFEEIGLFDENIFMYYEECDIKRRIIAKFGKNAIQYNKHMNYIHAHPKGKFNAKSYSRSLDSMKYFSAKYDLDLERHKRKILGNLKFFRLLALIKKDQYSVSEYDKSISYLKAL